jgi:hypothetical protein
MVIACVMLGRYMRDWQGGFFPFFYDWHQLYEERPGNRLPSGLILRFPRRGRCSLGERSNEVLTLGSCFLF